MPDLVTVGETLAVVRATAAGRLRPGAAAHLSFAGAESTVAIGVRRLGHTARWVGRLGADDLGDMILAGLRGEAVDVDHAARDPDRSTALLLRHRRTADRISVAYYRTDLAGASLSPKDIPPDAVAGARIVHLTGITPALGPSAAAAVDRAAELARAAGAAVTFDVNHRARLWPAGAARPTLTRLAAAADVVFAGLDEAAIVSGLAGGRDPAAHGEAILGLGAREAVIKLGARGAVAVTAAGAFRSPARTVTQVDPVGAGDAFVAGYISGMLDDLSVPERLRRACACGAFAAATDGDWEGLPAREELSLLGESGDVSR